MMTHDERHMPTPEFRARLEAEVSRALRQQERSAALRWKRWPSVRTVARLAAAILVGVVVGAAPAQVADARQRDSLLVAANAELRLATMRLQIAREEQERLAKLFAVGAVTEREMRSAERELRELEIALTALQRNIEETRATSRPPRDDIGAPVIGDRDYVKERLVLELRALQQDLSAAERHARDIDQRVKAGIEMQAAKVTAESELARLQAEMALLADKVRLRDEVVSGRAAADAAEAELQLLELQQRVRLHTVRLRAAQQRLEVVTAQVASGVVTRREALRAELEVAELQAALELLQFQLRRLQAGR